jgi:hypothetical protein
VGGGPFGGVRGPRQVAAEIPLTLEHQDGSQELPAGGTATVVYRLDVPLRQDRELARPVMLRDRRRRLFSSENLVEDLPLR